MNTVFQGTSGTQYRVLEPAAAKGGEGSIYRIDGRKDIVAKIFAENRRTEQRFQKLKVMLQVPKRDLLQEHLCWPRELLYQDGKPVGYLMTNLDGYVDLNAIYSGGYPEITFYGRVLLAQNLCVAVLSVHEAGQVCGDLNPNNIMVDPKTGRLMLVDTDSYHIRDLNHNSTYRCEVGIPEYLPKELLNKISGETTFANAPMPTYTTHTDRFALGIHIFALLMSGCHPFACAVKKGVSVDTVPQPAENIKSEFYVFEHCCKTACENTAGSVSFDRNHMNFTKPVYAPDISFLPDGMRKKFKKCFVAGNHNPSERPTEEEWYMELEGMKQSLSKCEKNALHVYPSHNESCPWCQILNSMRMAYQVHQEERKETNKQAAKKYEYRRPCPPKTPAPTQNTASANQNSSYDNEAEKKTIWYAALAMAGAAILMILLFL